LTKVCISETHTGGVLTKIINTSLHLEFLVVNFISVLFRMENWHTVTSLCTEIALYEGTLFIFLSVIYRFDQIGFSTPLIYNCHGKIFINNSCCGAGLCVERKPVFLSGVCLPKLVERSLAFVIKPPLMMTRVYEDIQPTFILICNF